MATIAEIAEWTDGQAVASQPNSKITLVSALDDADVDAVVFASAADALENALQSRAGVILASAKIAAEHNDKRLVLVKDPRLAFSIVGDRLRQSMTATIHPSAVIDATAQ